MHSNASSLLRQNPEDTHNIQAIRFALPRVSDFHIKTLYVFLAPTTHTLCPAHRNLLHINSPTPPPHGEWYCPQHSIYFFYLHSRYFSEKFVVKHFQMITQCLLLWLNGNISSVITDPQTIQDLSCLVCFLLVNSPASEFYMMFRNTLSVPSL